MQPICAIFRHTFKTNNEDILSISYNIIAIPMLLYGCEKWTLSKQHERRIETAALKISAAVYTVYYIAIKQMKK
jgi:hypothetical protein